MGRHNALNALAALALTSAVAKLGRPVLDALAAFRGLPHRMAPIAEAAGVLFVDDSKGTTVAATQVALEGIAPAGRADRRRRRQGPDFAPLKASVDARCRAVLLIGRDAPQIARALTGTQRARRDRSARWRRRSSARWRSQRRATPCCSRPLAQASTSSATTSSAATRFAELVNAALAEDVDA